MRTACVCNCADVSAYVAHSVEAHIYTHTHTHEYMRKTTVQTHIAKEWTEEQWASNEIQPNQIQWHNKHQQHKKVSYT